MVTRKLGFRYLWIDTMCILQDNPKDKDEEIQKMGDIYAGSTCNIAAASANDSRSSLFTRVLPLLSNQCYLRPSGSGGTFAIRNISGEGRQPLNDRGWVVQEKVLSPRSLEYTNVGIRWHCKGTADNESQIPSLWGWNRLLKHFQSSQARHQLRDNTGGRKRSISWPTQLDIAFTDAEKYVGQMAWTFIVGIYCRAKFSHEDDRKVGLLGVVSALKEHTGLSVTHGVCHDLFPYCLLWCMWGPLCFSENPPHYGPSWSNLYRYCGTCQVNSAYDEPHYCATNYSFDDHSSMISLTARSFRYLLKPKEATVELANDVDIPDSTGDLPKLSLYMDVTVINPIQVEFILLVQSPSHYEGLVLRKAPDNSGLWTRIGAFKDADENRTKYNKESYQGVLALFSEEKSYSIA